MNELFCPNCGCFCPVRYEEREEVLPVRGDRINITSTVAVCEQCGEDLFDEKVESDNLERAYRIYREEHGILTPSQVAELREKYGLSQRSFSRFLGWGDVTFHRYENGAIQDATHNSQLLMMRDPRNMQLLLETNGSCLSERIQKNLAQRIAVLINNEAEPRFRESLESLFCRTVDIYSGFRRFDIERFQSVVLYFCKAYSGVFKVKLLKSLWYADFLNYKENATSITGARYLHWQLGPVPENYELLLGDMIRLRMMWLENVEYKDGHDGERYHCEAEPELTLLTKAEEEVLDSVVDSFRNLSGYQLWKKTHGEAAYKETADNELIPYSFAEHLSL